jgi:hypothetical protein
MVRIAFLGVCLIGLSCQPPETPAPPPEPKPPAAHPNGFPVDYSKWDSLTEKPVVTNARAMLDCRAPVPFKLNADGTSPEGVNSPHHIPALKYFASPDQLKAVKEGKAPYPVGTTVVKEKLHSEDAKGPFAVAAMIKREKGYDPDHGDWEYVYTTLGEKPETQRGKLASCIQCHRIKKEEDYLFRSYLGKSKTVK